MEAGRPPTPMACPSRASPAPSAGKNNAEPLPFARRDPAPSVLLPSPDSLHVFISSAQVPRERRAQPPPDTGERTTLIFGSLLSHEFASILAINMSSKLQIRTVHAVYLLSDLLAGKLIALLTCGQSNPMAIPCRSPEAAHWDADGNRVRWQHQLLPQPSSQETTVQL